MPLLDGDSRADNISKSLESLVQVLMGPFIAKSLNENVTFSLDRAKQILVVGQGSASLAVQLGELDLLKKLTSVQNVLESGKRVIEVLHLWSLEHQVAFTSNRLDVLVELDH